MQNIFDSINPMLFSLPRFIGLFVLTLASLQIGKIGLRLIGRNSLYNKNTLALFNNVLRLLIIGVAGVTSLDMLGVSISPILTAIGVSGFAVALGLQDSLSNLFAGFHLLAGRLIHLGDVIQLPSGQVGSVSNISWRHTSLKNEEQNTTIIPNSQLTSSIFTNFSHPVPEISFEIIYDISSENDLEQVAKLAQNVWVRSAGSSSKQTVSNQGSFYCLSMTKERLLCSSTLVASNIAEKKLLTSAFLMDLHRNFKASGIRF